MVFPKLSNGSASGSAVYSRRSWQPLALPKRILVHFASVDQVVHGTQNIEKQLRFPPRKKRQTARAQGTKTADLREMLADVTEDHCAQCFQDNDNSDSPTINWTQCSKCNLWFHDACINQTDTPFICPFCAEKPRSTNRKQRKQDKQTSAEEPAKKRRHQSPDPDAAGPSGGGPSGPRRYNKVLRTEEVQNSTNVSAPEGNLVLRLRSGKEVLYLKLRTDDSTVTNCPDDDISEDSKLSARVTLESDLEAAVQNVPRKSSNFLQLEVVEPELETQNQQSLESPITPDAPKFPLCDHPARLRSQLDAFVTSVNFLKKKELYGPADEQAFAQQMDLLAVAYTRVLMTSGAQVRTRRPWKMGLNWSKRPTSVKKAAKILAAHSYFEDVNRKNVVGERAASSEVLYDPTGLWTGEKLRKRRYGPFDLVLPSDHRRVQRKQEEVRRGTQQVNSCQQQLETVITKERRPNPVDVPESCATGRFGSSEERDEKRKLRDEEWKRRKDEDENRHQERQERDRQERMEQEERDRRADEQREEHEKNDRETRQREADRRAEEKEREDRERSQREQQEQMRAEKQRQEAAELREREQKEAQERHERLQQLREQRRQWEEARAEQQRQREAAESREREEREARERHERLQELREQRRQHEERRNAHCSNMKFMMMLIVAIVGVITIAINNAYYDSVE